MTITILQKDNSNAGTVTLKDDASQLLFYAVNAVHNGFEQVSITADTTVITVSK